MKKAINLEKFVCLLQKEKISCENKIQHLMRSQYYRLGILLHKHFENSLEQAFKMLFCPKYSLNIELSFNIYKVKDNRYLLKKPNFFKSLFRRFSIHKIIIKDNDIILDDEIIADKQAREIWLII
ncbi:hypothetical protein [Helicobacter sp. MIT 05-5294]|uniref:hypothetical protein n=1 Tax=Helicobacter sp. MIT 05-5294 TaxID=1548150 RepID=UPI0010FD1AA8|nr:hypothetical protein [Helicobacter sp. MIT 05-5294]TLD85486.1 hypothetical protein LS69_009305 [Helicobacter sp. MIT 05-5294]